MAGVAAAEGLFSLLLLGIPSRGRCEKGLRMHQFNTGVGDDDLIEEE